MSYLTATYRRFGYWTFKPERTVRLTEKEAGRLYVRRPERHHRLYLRFGLTFHYDSDYPAWFSLEHKLPRKTLKALWKSSNGQPLPGPKTQERRPLIHNGRKA